MKPLNEIRVFGKPAIQTGVTQVALISRQMLLKGAHTVGPNGEACDLGF